MRAFDRPFGALIRAVTGLGSPAMARAGFERPPRELFPREREILSSALGDAIDLDRVRIVSARSLDTWVPREGHVARAIGDTIFWPTRDISAPDQDLSLVAPATLVHEACHVVQFQRGGSVYIGDSVRAQLACIVRGRSRSGAYDWEAAFDGGRSWAELGAEQQASLIEEAWRTRGATIDRRVLEALAEARAGRGWCGSPLPDDR